MKMKIEIFSIHDNKASAYLPPFNLPTTQMAVRTFTDTLNDPNHAFAKHPEDYTLFHIGTFDDSNAVIELKQSKVPIGNGTDFQSPSTLDDPQVNVIHERIDILDEIISKPAIDNEEISKIHTRIYELSKKLGHLEKDKPQLKN